MELSNFELCDRSDRFALLQCLVMVVRDRCHPSQYEGNQSYQAYCAWRKRQGDFSNKNYRVLIDFLLELEAGLHGRESAGGAVAPSPSIVGWAGLDAKIETAKETSSL